MSEQRAEIRAAVERYLRQAPGDGWVKGADLAAAFDLRDTRYFRSWNGEPGLCSEFAISADKGFKHVERATTGEWLRFKHRMRRHAVSELARSGKLDRRRSNAIRSIRRPEFTFQRDTGQGVLLP